MNDYSFFLIVLGFLIIYSLADRYINYLESKGKEPKDEHTKYCEGLGYPVKEEKKDGH